MKHYTAEDVLRLAKAKLVGQTIMTDDNLSAMLFNKKHVAELINAAVEAERKAGDARVLAEREACAKACDAIAGNCADFEKQVRRRAGGICAAAIRARGGKE